MKIRQISKMLKHLNLRYNIYLPHRPLLLDWKLYDMMVTDTVEYLSLALPKRHMSFNEV